MAKKNSLISKGRYELQFRGIKCLNCGHPLDMSDKYCPNCSQANSTKKLTLKDFVHEFFSGVFNYDSRLLKTLSALLWRPGKITKDYIEGKRVSYTNPFRFLLSLAFIYFLMFTFNNEFSSLDKAASRFDGNLISNSPVSYNVKSGTFTTDSTKFKEETAKVLEKLDSSQVNTNEVIKGMQILDSIAETSSLEDQRKDSLILANPTKFYATLESKSGINNFMEKVGFFSKMIKRDTLFSFSETQDKYNVKPSVGNRMAFNSANSLLKVISRPGTFLNSSISRMPFVIFLFLPLFTVFIWLVYIRKKHTYTDHLIFSFHNQSLLFILLILSLIIDAIFNVSSAILFITIFSVYLFMAMKRFYRQGTFKTIVKYLFLNTIFTILAFIAVIILFTGSVFMY